MDMAQQVAALEKKIAALEVEARERDNLLNTLLKDVGNLQMRIAGLEKQCSRQIVNGRLIVGDSTISSLIHHMESIDFRLEKEVQRLDQRINYFHP